MNVKNGKKAINGGKTVIQSGTNKQTDEQTEKWSSNKRTNNITERTSERMN